VLGFAYKNLGYDAIVTDCLGNNGSESITKFFHLSRHMICMHISSGDHGWGQHYFSKYDIILYEDKFLKVNWDVMKIYDPAND